jgi:hypothetical protein
MASWIRESSTTDMSALGGQVQAIGGNVKPLVGIVFDNIRHATHNGQKSNHIPNNKSSNPCGCMNE